MLEPISSRPATASILSIIGGVFVLLVGLLRTFVGAMLAFFALGIGGVLGLWGVLCGVIMTVGRTTMGSWPKEHVLWGVFVLVFSILSVGKLRGLGIGFLLGLTGGILAIAWKPS